MSDYQVYERLNMCLHALVMTSASLGDLDDLPPDVAEVALAVRGMRDHVVTLCETHNPDKRPPHLRPVP